MSRSSKAKIAQLVEHIHGKDEVPGSIPGLGSRSHLSSVGRARLS